MAFCEIIEVVGTKFGQCGEELDGEVELDLVKLISGETPKEAPLGELNNIKYLRTKFLARFINIFLNIISILKKADTTHKE